MPPGRDPVDKTAEHKRAGPRFAIDPRDPFGRTKVGVKVSDGMRRQPPPQRPAWKIPIAVEELEDVRRDFNASRGSAQDEFEYLRRLVENGQRDKAVTRVRRNYGYRCTLEEAIAKEQAAVDRCAGEIRRLDIEITCLLWEEVYPGAPSPQEYDRMEHVELVEGRQPLGFDHTDTLVQMLWDEIVDQFADKGFGENAEILVAMRERLGLGGICQLVTAIRNEDAASMQRFCDLVTAYEKRISMDVSYNRLIVRRGAGGKLLIVIDQPGNPDYTPALVTQSRVRAFVRRRLRARRRESQGGNPCRRRGSRRVASRSTGGGSSGDDPDPEPLARTGTYGLAGDRMLWDIAVKSFGALIGDGIMGLEGKLVGGVVAYLWGCWRWHRRSTRMRRG